MKIDKFIYVDVVICLVFFSCKTDNLEKKVTKYIEKHSGKTISENQYYFLLNTKSCHACNEVIITFLNQYESRKPINLILKGNAKREIKAQLPLNDKSNLRIANDLTKTKTNLKMPILINAKAQVLEINEINIYNYKKILSKIN